MTAWWRREASGTAGGGCDVLDENAFVAVIREAIASNRSRPASPPHGDIEAKDLRQSGRMSERTGGGSPTNCLAQETQLSGVDSRLDNRAGASWPASEGSLPSWEE